jgi:hypothetical protein
MIEFKIAGIEFLNCKLGGVCLNQSIAAESYSARHGEFFHVGPPHLKSCTNATMAIRNARLMIMIAMGTQSLLLSAIPRVASFILADVPIGAARKGFWIIDGAIAARIANAGIWAANGLIACCQGAGTNKQSNKTNNFHAVGSPGSWGFGGRAMGLP